MSDPEGLVICPYEKSHTIRRCALMTHLHKCARNHGYRLAVCPFNVSHHVHPDELKAHEASCPDRHSFQAALCKMDGEATSLIPFENIDLPPSTEDWEDGQVGGFDPKNAKDPDGVFLIRGKHCVTPSERKEFKHERRAMAKEFMEQSCEEPRRPPVAKQLSDSEPLRLPMTAPPGAKEKKVTKISDFLLRSVKGLEIKESHGEQAPTSQPLVTSSLEKEVQSVEQVSSAAPPTGINWLSTGRGKRFAVLTERIHSVGRETNNVE